LPWQFLDFSLLLSFDQAKESKLIVKLKLTCYQKLKLFNIKKIRKWYSRNAYFDFAQYDSSHE
jgi:hypothetical protein